MFRGVWCGRWRSRWRRRAALADLDAYRASCPLDSEKSRDDDAQFVDILITDGRADSTVLQIEQPFADLLALGVVTHIVGFGAPVAPRTHAELFQQLAEFASDGAHDDRPTHSTKELAAALVDTAGALTLCE